jgi:hypothetical protein
LKVASISVENMDAISLLAEACSHPSLSQTQEVSEAGLTIDTDAIINETGSSVNTPMKSSSRGNWTAEEDELLRNAVQQYGGRNWKKISDQIPDRTDVQCLHRWQKVLRPGLVKGPWTPEVCILLSSLGKASSLFVFFRHDQVLNVYC